MSAKGQIADSKCVIEKPPRAPPTGRCRAHRQACRRLCLLVGGGLAGARYVGGMSALPPKADIGGAKWNARFGPLADISVRWGNRCLAGWVNLTGTSLFKRSTLT